MAFEFYSRGGIPNEAGTNIKYEWGGYFEIRLPSGKYKLKTHYHTAQDITESYTIVILPDESEKVVILSTEDGSEIIKEITKQIQNGEL